MYRGLLIYRECDAGYNRDYIEYYLKLAPQFQLHLTFICYERICAAITEEGHILYDITAKNRISADFAMNRTRDSELARHLEAMGIRVFNSARVTELGNDKWKMYRFAKSHTDLPCIPTALMPAEIPDIEPRLQGREWIFKAVSGHGGSRVFCYPKESLASIKKGTAGDRVVLQPRIHGIPRDVRVYVVGGRIAAAILRTGKKGGWRSNYSLGGKSCVYDLSGEEEQMAGQLAGILKPDMAGIDFIVGGDGKWYFNELEDMAGARTLYADTDIDIARLYLEHIKRSLA